ncbi:MAG: hypothetical protein MI749_16060 [Desulfovibrionales bacterium]|nr:hypothetical protein [Desulfovibrionales bacterium]
MQIIVEATEEDRRRIERIARVRDARIVAERSLGGTLVNYTLEKIK